MQVIEQHINKPVVHHSTEMEPETLTDTSPKSAQCMEILKGFCTVVTFQDVPFFHIILVFPNKHQFVSLQVRLELVK